jgi:hypothetical protein
MSTAQNVATLKLPMVIMSTIWWAAISIIRMATIATIMAR